MPNQSKRSHWVRVGAVVGLCCGVTIIACVTRLYFGYAANNAIPGTTAIVLNQPHGKDSFFSKNPNSSNDVLALLDGLEAGMGAVIAQDSGWQEGIWMAHRLGTGRYGWSVALNQDLPAIEAKTRTLEAHSTYRNVDIYQLAEEVWTARYRSLWLAGNQPHLIENMVTELKDQRRSWPFRDEDRLVVATENLSAFFSGLLKGNLLKWLQRLEQKNLMLSVDSIAPMNLVGQLSQWTTQHNVPSPAAVSSYLPAQTAWCMAIAIDTLPQAAPMGSYLNSWLGNHQIVIQLALPGDELMNRVVLWPAEHARAKTGIAAISKALGTIDSYTFQMFEVLQLPGDRLFKALIPGGLTNPYIAVLGDY
ncbi:MAG: hypothetical protein HRU12_23720, partial [Phaeodactylibacter sp.]|nr:hypothetical protein [Phaeodactylibacter sp.]